MGRIRREIDVDGQKYWTLFDSGSRNTYVTEEVAKVLPTFNMPASTQVALGGKIHKISKDCRLTGTIDVYPFLTHARIIDEIGKDEDGNEIQILFGALAMQEWGIKLNVPNETLDMTHYSKEFVEY